MWNKHTHTHTPGFSTSITATLYGSDSLGRSVAVREMAAAGDTNIASTSRAHSWRYRRFRSQSGRLLTPVPCTDGLYDDSIIINVHFFVFLFSFLFTDPCRVPDSTHWLSKRNKSGPILVVPFLERGVFWSYRAALLQTSVCSEANGGVHVCYYFSIQCLSFTTIDRSWFCVLQIILYVTIIVSCRHWINKLVGPPSPFAKQQCSLA